VKYLIMIQSNPQSRAAWETWTTEQQMEFGRAHYALSDELAASGLLVASEGLADPARRAVMFSPRAVMFSAPAVMLSSRAVMLSG
jgi:hypothetical protein